MIIINNNNYNKKHAEILETALYTSISLLVTKNIGEDNPI